MRILLVGRNAKTGGGTTFRLNISRGLIERGHGVWLACQPGEVLPRYRAAGVHYVWTPPAPWGGLWIERAIRANRIDLVHASNATPGTAAEWAVRRTGTPFIMSVHGLLGKHDHTRPCLQLARKILTFEEVAVESLSKKQVIDMSKVSVKGSDMVPLYGYLTSQTGGDVKWNFTKFLVGKDGKIVQRFESKVTPDSSEMSGAIEQALAK